MRVLIDECVPKTLKVFLTANDHECLTVQAGWSGKTNGELLNLAETKFDVFITLDTNLPYQQNLAGRRIAIVLVLAASNRLVQLTRQFPACAEALKTIRPGEIVCIERPI